ncbi:hypothetical protein TWF132_004031 [Orbilia oligospora]|nr:hypothetical protein TWF132_004031 [Orbilia oligospora]
MANQKLRTIQDLNSKSAKYLDILTMWLVVIALGWALTTLQPSAEDRISKIQDEGVPKMTIYRPILGLKLCIRVRLESVKVGRTNGTLALVQTLKRSNRHRLEALWFTKECGNTILIDFDSQVLDVTPEAWFVRRPIFNNATRFLTVTTLETELSIAVRIRKIKLIADADVSFAFSNKDISKSFFRGTSIRTGQPCKRILICRDTFPTRHRHNNAGLKSANIG